MGKKGREVMRREARGIFLNDERQAFSRDDAEQELEERQLSNWWLSLLSEQATMGYTAHTQVLALEGS